MISEKEFLKVKKKLERRNNNSCPKIYNHNNTGIIRCGNCGAMVTAERKKKIQKNKNVHH